MNNKIVVIGSTHMNTLGVIRAFGEQGIMPFLFLIGEQKDYILSSKYAVNSFVFSDEESAVSFMLKLFEHETKNPVVIPTTDSAASYLDAHYDSLSKRFCLHHINHKENMINHFMDKFCQYQLFSECGVPCLKGFVLQLDKPSTHDSLSFPCILKPHISAKGDKADIAICNNIDEYEAALFNLKQHNYTSIFVQEYLNFDTEFDIVGFMYHDEIFVPGMSKKIRIWPQKKGSATFAEACPVNEKIIQMLKAIFSSIHYEGIFDVEVFKKGDDFYLNEINFRNSGLSYAYKDFYPAFYWYLSNVKEEFTSGPLLEKSYFFMNEEAEIKQLLEKNISLKTHLYDRKRTHLFLIKNKLDPKPSKVILKRKIVKVFKKVLPVHLP